MCLRVSFRSHQGIESGSGSVVKDTELDPDQHHNVTNPQQCLLTAHYVLGPKKIFKNTGYPTTGEKA
jgi:hypothetical protein